jgi:hypothetical protein
MASSDFANGQKKDSYVLPTGLAWQDMYHRELLLPNWQKLQI